MNQPSTDGDGRAFRLMYRSHSLIPPTDRRRELGSIFSDARSSNKRAGISGALLISDDWFVQVLEGDETDVRALFGRISSDTRHEDVTLLEAGDVGQRVFARWAMAKVAADGEPDIPLITNVDKGGIVGAVPRGTTSEQDSVLDVMRGCLREGASSAADATVAGEGH